MSEIVYVRGDATAASGKGVKEIAHVRNDIGGWGRGFVPALSRRRPEPEAAYRAWHRGRASKPLRTGRGPVRGGRAVCVGGQHGRAAGDTYGQKGRPGALRGDRRDARAAGAQKTAELGASVHMPRTGCGPAGGEWSRVETLIIERLARRGTAVTVYDRGEGGS